jgi:hypothetical protein
LWVPIEVANLDFQTMEPGGQPATSLNPDNPKFPQKVRDILLKAQNAWLKNTEVCDLLLHYSEYSLPVAREPPSLPPGKQHGPALLLDHKDSMTVVAHPDLTLMGRVGACAPPGGSLFLFDRRAVRFFRKDGHNWRKKADGKTVRETHEKLKVGHKRALHTAFCAASSTREITSCWSPCR